VTHEEVLIIAAALDRIADGLMEGAKATREWTADRALKFDAQAEDRRCSRDRDEVLYQRYAADAEKARTDADVSRLLADALLRVPKWPESAK
jgi:hypothetical protein